MKHWTKAARAALMSGMAVPMQAQGAMQRWIETPRADHAAADLEGPAPARRPLPRP